MYPQSFKIGFVMAYLLPVQMCTEHTKPCNKQGESHFC